MATTKRYLHIAFNFPPLWMSLQAAVQNMITRDAADWVRYATNCWIVWTAEAPKDWGDKFNAEVSRIQNSSFLIVSVDLGPTSDGWASLPQWAWDWLKRPRY